MNIVVVKPASVVVATAIAEAAAFTLDLNTIIMAVIGLMGSYLTMRMAALAAAAKEQKTAQDAATVSMREIHTAVNSGKTILENKLDGFMKQNVELTSKVATLEEKLRGVDLAKAAATAPPMVVMPSVPVSPVVVHAAPAPAVATATPAPSATRMGDAIIELKEAAEETSVAADKTVEIVDKQMTK